LLQKLVGCGRLTFGVAFVLVSARGLGMPTSDPFRKPTPKSTPKVDDEAESEVRPPLRGDELRETLPDLTSYAFPPVLLLTPAFGLRSPYHVGLGLDADIHPSARLRVGATYSLGLTLFKATILNSYAELSFGVAVLRFASETVIELPVRSPFSSKVERIKVVVASYHSLFLEGGGITTFVYQARCAANCDLLPTGATLKPDELQLVMPFGGLRYEYFYAASSERARFGHRNLFGLYAHFIGRPFNPPDHDILKWDGDRMQRASFGWRVGFDAKPLYCDRQLFARALCTQMGVTIGQNPVPKYLIFQATLSYAVF
jgi:hypothetical protein